MKGSHIYPQIPEVHKGQLQRYSLYVGLLLQSKGLLIVAPGSRIELRHSPTTKTRELARETDISGKLFALRHWLVPPLAFSCTNTEVGKKRELVKAKLTSHGLSYV